MVLQSAEGLARAAVERAQDLVELAAAKMRLAALSGLTMLLCVMVAVRRIALRADVDLRQLDAARDRLVADIRGTLTAPLALIGCFVGGVVVGGRGNLGGGCVAQTEPPAGARRTQGSRAECASVQSLCRVGSRLTARTQRRPKRQRRPLAKALAGVGQQGKQHASDNRGHLDRPLASRVRHVVHDGRVHPHSVGHRGRNDSASRRSRSTRVVTAPIASVRSWAGWQQEEAR